MEIARNYINNKNFKAAERELNQILHGEIAKDATTIHEACLLQSYALCNIYPTYSESFRISFDSDFVNNSALDLSEARLKCSLNWLAKALSVGVNEMNTIQIKNVSIAYLEIGKTNLLTKPDVFISLGRTIAEALEKLDDNAFPKWRAFFHSILAYVELLYAGCCGNDLVYEQLKIASRKSKKHYSVIQSCMKIFGIISKKATSFSAKWGENRLTKTIVDFLQGKHQEMDKVEQMIATGQLERAQCPIYIDSTWLGIELLKEYLVKEDYQKATRMFEKLQTHQNGTFDYWIHYFEEALSILKNANHEIPAILKSLESMAKMIMNASIEGNHDFVVCGATILWNVTFPKLKESPQRFEVIRIFEIILKSLCKSSSDSTELKSYYEGEISKYYGVLTSSVSNHQDKSLANASYSLNIAASMAASKALIILSDSIRVIEPTFTFEPFEIRLQKLKKQEFVFSQAKIMLLIDISRHSFKLLKKKPLKEDEKSQLEDLLVFSNDLLLNSNAIESASSAGINLETIFEILMIQCDGIARRALSLLKNEKNDSLDKTMEYGLDICQKSLAVSVTAGHFWMSHNAIAQFWKFFCELFQSFPSEHWTEPIYKIYESVIAKEDSNDTLKTLVTIMYARSQLEIYSALASKAVTANVKGTSSSSSINLKNAEEALKILMGLKDDNLGTIVLIVPCWIKLHQLKTSATSPISFLESEDPIFKLISNFEISLKDQTPPKITNRESIENMFLSIKAASSIPASFQVRMCLRLAKLASDQELFDFAIGIYSKLFDLLDNLESRAISENLNDVPETNCWISNARFDAVNRYIMDLSAADKVCNLNLLQYLVDNYRKQCLQDVISTEIFQGTIKSIWNFSICFINEEFGGAIIELITKFLARTVKTVLKDDSKTQKTFSNAIGAFETDVFFDLIMICVDYYVNIGNMKLAVEILDSTNHIISSSKLAILRSKILQHVSKRRLLDYKSCLMFGQVLKSPVEREAIFRQAIALAKEPNISAQERQQFAIDLLSQRFFDPDLGEFMTEDIVAKSDCQYVFAKITYETRMAELTLSMQERLPLLEKLKKLVLHYISLVLKEAERLRAEQLQAALATEKPAGKGDAKKNNSELVSQNLDFSLPAKWDNNYQWPKTVKAALSQSKMMAKNHLLILEDLQMIIKLNACSNQLADCFSYLNLADALAEGWLEKTIVFKVAMSLNHAIFLKKCGSPFEAKTRSVFAELDEKFDEILTSITGSEDLNQSKYHIMIADFLVELGDYSRANSILSNLKNVSRFLSNPQIEGQCLLRIAQINLLSSRASDSFAKDLLKRCMDLLENTSTDYMEAFKLLSTLQPESVALKIEEILEMKFSHNFLQANLEANWLNLLMDLCETVYIPNAQIKLILGRLFKNCFLRYDYMEWYIATKKYLQSLVNKNGPFPMEDIHVIADAIPLEHLDTDSSLEIRRLILLINVMDLVSKSLNQEEICVDVNPVDKFLDDTDPNRKKNNQTEPRILDSVDFLLQKLSDTSADGHWIATFGVGMLNYIKWKKTQDHSLKENVTSNLSKLVEAEVDKRYTLMALEALLHVLEGDDSRIKYLSSLQDCLFTEKKARVLSTSKKSKSSNDQLLKYQEKQIKLSSHYACEKNFVVSLPTSTIVIILQYSTDQKYLFGGILYSDLEKKMCMMTSQVEVSTNDHTLNIGLCADILLREINFPAKEIDQSTKTHLILSLDTKLMSLDVESLFHQRLQGVKSISIEFSLNSFLSKQVLLSQEVDGKKKEEKKDKKKDKEKDEHKAIELDPEILTVTSIGGIVRCSSSHSCLIARDALEKVMKTKGTLLVAEGYSIEELQHVMNNRLVLLLLDKMVDIKSLPDLTGKIIIALYYSFGDPNPNATAQVALELMSLGAYACFLVKGAMLSENEMIEEAVEILHKASEGQGYIETFRKGTRWYGPRFQFAPSFDFS